MYRIRRVFDDTAPLDARRIEQVQYIMKQQFPDMTDAEARRLPEKLRNPLKERFRYHLFVADRGRDQVEGFALVSIEPNLRFCYLDYISAASGSKTGRGIGGSLYERVREEAKSLGCLGVFFEVLPDEAELCRDEAVLKESIARLRFYERYGARPIVNIAYQEPWSEKSQDRDNLPFLLFDGLGEEGVLKKSQLKLIIRAILERKFGDICTPEYIAKVVRSVKDDPVLLRAPRYRTSSAAPPPPPAEKPSFDRRIALIVTEGHTIHHIADKGYLEAPVRISRILDEIDKTEIFRRVRARHYPDSLIHAVHDHDFVKYLRDVCSQLGEKESVYPYVFPLRNRARPPVDLPLKAGYYCMDTFTPISKNAWSAARAAADCAVAGAEEILGGGRLAYALVRPPGHHAERRAFGGFCYLNNTAIAADYLSRHGKVAVLDIDYHHGNGTQDIFYRRPDVFTLSIHGHPRAAYPYFSGFKEETGEGQGQGFNVNYPLGDDIGGDEYRETLRKALERIVRYHPRFLVVALGLDTAQGDPTGSWLLRAKDFEKNGAMIADLNLPVLFIQEGGYRTRSLGANAAAFFRGAWQSVYGQPNEKKTSISSRSKKRSVETENHITGNGDQ